MHVKSAVFTLNLCNFFFVLKLMDIYILHGNNYLDNEDVEALETPFRVRLVEGNVTILFDRIIKHILLHLNVILIISR